MGRAHSTLAKETLEKIHKTTGKSKSEISDAYEAFHRENPSGVINREDFKKQYARIFPHGDSTRFAELVFNAYDKNSDGTIDFEEYMIVRHVSKNGTLEQKLNWFFAVYDANKDGVISKEEMTDMFKTIHQMVGGMLLLQDSEFSPEARTEKIFRQVDKNMDGVLSKEEFLEGAKLDPSIERLLKGIF